MFFLVGNLLFDFLGSAREPVVEAFFDVGFDLIFARFFVVDEKIAAARANLPERIVSFQAFFGFINIESEMREEFSFKLFVGNSDRFRGFTRINPEFSGRKFKG